MLSDIDKALYSAESLEFKGVNGEGQTDSGARTRSVKRLATPNECTNPPPFVVLNAEMSSSTARSHPQTAFRLNGVRYSLYLADCLAWMDQQSANSIHAIVTDPPYGLKEYTTPEKQKLRRGKGGVWRIPPAFDGCVRSPLPRFTVLTDDELSKLRRFFSDFGPASLAHHGSRGPCFHCDESAAVT